MPLNIRPFGAETGLVHLQPTPGPQRPVWGPPDVSEMLMKGLSSVIPAYQQARSNQTQEAVTRQVAQQRQEEHALAMKRAGLTDEFGRAIAGMDANPAQAIPALQNLYGQGGAAPAAPGSLPTFARMQGSAPSGRMAELVQGAANTYKLDPAYIQTMGSIESSWNPDAKNKSGAAGVFQFMPQTWAQYGRGDIMDVEAQFDAMGRFTAQNRDQLRNALGREPTNGELYLAHQQGAGGAIKLLSNPNARAADLVGEKAVAANVPGALRNSAGNLTAGQFASLWKGRFDDPTSRNTGAAPAQAAAAPPPLPPQRPTQVASADPTMTLPQQAAPVPPQSPVPGAPQNLPLFATPSQPSGSPGGMQMPPGTNGPMAGAPAPAPAPQTAPAAPLPAPQTAIPAPQAPAPVQTAQAAPGAPQQVMPAAAAQAGRVTPQMMQALSLAVRSGDPQAVAVARQLMQLQQGNADYNFTQAPDGTLYRTNTRSGSVEAVDAGHAKGRVQEVNGVLVEENPRDGSWRPVYGQPLKGAGGVASETLLPPGDPRRVPLGIPQGDERVWRLEQTSTGYVRPVPVNSEGARDDKPFTQENQLRDQYFSQTKTQQQTRDGYSRVQATIADMQANGAGATPASDMGLIFGYMKMLDPGSVVREGEYANAQNAGSIPERIQAMYNKAKDGQLMTEPQRADFIRQVYNLQKENVRSHNAQAKRFRALAERKGLDPESVAELWEEPGSVPNKADFKAGQGGGTSGQQQGQRGTEANPIPVMSETEAAQLPAGTWIEYTNRSGRKQRAQVQ